MKNSLFPFTSPVISRISIRQYAIAVSTRQYSNAPIEDIVKASKAIESYVLDGIEVPNTPDMDKSPYKDVLDILKVSMQPYPSFNLQKAEKEDNYSANKFQG